MTERVPSWGAGNAGLMWVAGFQKMQTRAMLRAYLNYGLIAAVVIWGAIVAVMAYRLEDSPWRWAFVALVFAGALTVAAIVWIKKYVDRQMQSSERRHEK